jgi:hypothetical protein
MLVVVLVGAVSLTIGGVLGWLFARKVRGTEPAVDEPEKSQSIDDLIEAEIERLSVALSRRYGRPESEQLFARKLRLAYLLRDRPREREETT